MNQIQTIKRQLDLVPSSKMDDLKYLINAKSLIEKLIILQSQKIKDDKDNLEKSQIWDKMENPDF